MGGPDGIWPFRVTFVPELLVGGLSEGGPPPPGAGIHLTTLVINST